ncbi:MAG: ANTAR domain-containing protein [Oscillospiraceae bacterium]|nr:ANTAR domain-containing protein [Oscillospiraceae bacterium]
MDKTLIISGSEQALSLLSDLMKSYNGSQIVSASSGNEARRLINRTDFDMVIISTPLPDEFGNELAATIAEKTSAGVMLICKSDIAEEISEKVEVHGVCVLAKPLNKTLFFHSVKLLQATRARMLSVMKEYSKLQTKIEESRLINRAKCILIQYLKLTEPQAHRYIEKQAMDQRISKLEVAKNILKTYEA